MYIFHIGVCLFGSGMRRVMLYDLAPTHVDIWESLAPIVARGARGGRQEMQLQRQTVDAHLMRIYRHVIHGYFYPLFELA